MSAIPEARHLIEGILPAISAALPAEALDLRHALDLMHRRRPAKPRAPVRSAVVCPTVAAAIRAYVAAHPRESIQSIAVKFRTNSGRVSEALHGDR